MNTKDFAARSLDVQAFAKADGRLQGDAAVRLFPRILEETSAEGADRPVHWTAAAELRNPHAVAPQAWLHLSAHTLLALTCQRCLRPADIPVAFERSFRFVADEATAEAEDELSEEDVLATRHDFPLFDLIEDEILLTMPVVPVHDVCPVALPTEVKDPEFDAAMEERPNPFAVLQDLARKPAGK